MGSGAPRLLSAAVIVLMLELRLARSKLTTQTVSSPGLVARTPGRWAVCGTGPAPDNTLCEGRYARGDCRGAGNVSIQLRKLCPTLCGVCGKPAALARAAAESE